MITVYTQIYKLRKKFGRFASTGGNPDMLLTNRLTDCVGINDVWGLKTKMVFLSYWMSLHIKISC